jgi:hypothetical protein
MFKRFEDAMPEFDKKILLLFEASGHVEDATIRPDPGGEGGWIYHLFDGECLSDHPTHWAPMPEISS